MRLISSDIIFPINKPPIRNGVLVIDDHGKIIDLLDPGIDTVSPDMQIEKFPGAICPAFINTHCHLELSHLQGEFSKGKGLPVFIGEMIEKRKSSKEAISHAMATADNEMFENGISVAGDISNTADSILQKHKSKIYYHTFIELFDIFPERANAVFNDGLLLQKNFSDAGLKSSIVPHAPYTVSEKLLKMIAGHALKSRDIITIHNQETLSENEMFENGTGDLIDKLKKISKAFNDWQPTGTSSLSSVMHSIDANLPLQLVHNTFSDSEEIQRAIERHRNLYWCLCPNANLFIENALPDVQYLSDAGCKISIGTDSYASNTSLSILDELKTISRYYPFIDLTMLLKWATINGAEYLQVNKLFGSLEKGKSPGVILISNMNIENFKLKEESKVIRII